jgi:hypothetical protein
MAKAPTSLTIFAYQVGFGDCFLLRFTYPDMQRFVLIDFGTTALSVDAEKDQMLRIANDIKAKCGARKRLHAVVATHRHADHISGFATNATGDGPGDIIRALKPTVVVQPWTEEPELAVNARGPLPDGVNALRGMAALTSMHKVAENVVSWLDAKPKGLAAETMAQLRFIGEDNLKNKSAVQNLMSMGTRQSYVYHGSKSGLEAILPGVTTHVLGPPTLAQTDTISKMKARDPEYWHFALRNMADGSAANGASTAAPAFPDHVAAKGGKLPMPSRWLAYRARRARGEQWLSLVRSLDKQMNNTSVILLFQTARRKLLFPGDAQIENWRYALDQPKTLALLSDVDVYKVGHHGSLNATPHKMWDNFSKKGDAKAKGRMTSLLSTRTDKHGFEVDNTEVPRRTLLKELSANSCLHSTHTLASDKLYDEIEIPL